MSEIVTVFPERIHVVVDRAFDGCFRAGGDGHGAIHVGPPRYGQTHLRR